ncbi:MAG: hypothetical protein ABS92_15905 [Thiobacillus sp. SCN 63-374]|nr:MAG: hypothetical protein ABS92_15905 [Thiobacillus sp. SCN 63-374]
MHRSRQRGRLPDAAQIDGAVARGESARHFQYRLLLRRPFAIKHINATLPVVQQLRAIGIALPQIAHGPDPVLFLQGGKRQPDTGGAVRLVFLK